MVVEDGKVVAREPMSGLELVDFPGIGTLESFLTDGLRSLVDTVKARHMVERTLRYPGHIELMKAFWHAGLFSKEPVEVSGGRVRPVDVTSAVLFPKWAYAEGEADLTVMRVVTEGRRGGERVRLCWDLFDRYDAATGLRSMPRTTAFPATATARRLISGAFTAPGVHAPEALGPRFLDGILEELRERGVQVSAREERLG
jgi:saccharopine dehydrogenase-like NADP-dependent oxidoreductase